MKPGRTADVGPDEVRLVGLAALASRFSSTRHRYAIASPFGRSSRRVDPRLSGPRSTLVTTRQVVGTDLPIDRHLIPIERVHGKVAMTSTNSLSLDVRNVASEKKRLMGSPDSSISRNSPRSTPMLSEA